MNQTVGSAVFLWIISCCLAFIVRVLGWKRVYVEPFTSFPRVENLVRSNMER